MTSFVNVISAIVAITLPCYPSDNNSLTCTLVEPLECRILPPFVGELTTPQPKIPGYQPESLPLQEDPSVLSTKIPIYEDDPSCIRQQNKRGQQEGQNQ